MQTTKTPISIPLTEKELRRMNDKCVHVKYPTIEFNALVSFHAIDDEDYDETDGSRVYLTNNLGGRSSFEEVIEDGGQIFLV